MGAGESLPDIAVLCALAELYGVTLDYLVREHTRRPSVGRYKKRRRAIVSVMSCLLVWVVATAVYSVLLIWRHAGRAVACVHLGASGYGRRVHRIFLRVGEPLSPCRFRFRAHMDACPGALSHHPVRNMWLVFVVSVPVQALAVFWFILRKSQNNVC